MIAVGLTGGPACGKSAAAKVFARLGADTASADAIVHGLMKKGRPEYGLIVSRFGTALLGPDGEIDRSKLRRRALASETAMDFLERTLHPGVRREIMKLMKGKGKVLVVEVPLLFETGFDKLFDGTVAVVAGPKAQRRLAAAKGMSEEDLARFAKRQWSNSKKAAKADYVIRNDGALDGLRARVKKVFSRIKSTRLSAGRHT